MIFAQAFNVSAYGVLGHGTRLLEGIALGDKAR